MPPPPIPPRKAEGQDEAGIPPPIPVRSPRRPPIGAVATAMVSGQSGRWGLADGQGTDENNAEAVAEDGTHATNPYDLKAMAGSTVTASYPFHGEEDLQQLSFAVGDFVGCHRRKTELWNIFEE